MSCKLWTEESFSLGTQEAEDIFCLIIRATSLLESSSLGSGKEESLLSDLSYGLMTE